MLEKQFLQNLDKLTPEELSTYVLRFNQLTLEGEEAAVRTKLCSYAVQKAKAIKARTQKTVATAIQLEAGCDAIYKSLPAYAQW